MRIWFLIRSLEVGGAERQLVTLVSELRRRGLDVGVIVFYRGGALDKEVIANGIPLSSPRKRGRWDVLGFLLRLVRILRQIRPHVLHTYLVMPNILGVILRPLFPGMRVVWGVRASNMDLTRYDWLARWGFGLSRHLARYADLVIANSWAGAVYHQGHGYPREKMRVIPNGIDTERFRTDPAGRDAVRRNWGVKYDEKVIGLVARLDPLKDHLTFLRAASLLARDRQDVRFVCVGDGPERYRRHLEQTATEWGLRDRLLFVGPRLDMPAVYGALDILTSSSSWGEGFSNSVAEAMACGVPCVVTDVGDLARIVGDTGIVVPPKDPGAMCRAWVELLSLPPQEYQRRSEAARQRVVAHFSVQSLAERTIEALSSLVDRNPVLEGSD